MTYEILSRPGKAGEFSDQHGPAEVVDTIEGSIEDAERECSLRNAESDSFSYYWRQV